MLSRHSLRTLFLAVSGTGLVIATSAQAQPDSQSSPAPNASVDAPPPASPPPQAIPLVPPFQGSAAASPVPLTLVPMGPASAPYNHMNQRNRDVEFWQAFIGGRGTWISDAGLDPFSKANFLPSFTLGGTRTLLTRAPLSLAVGLLWDRTLSESTARGAPSSLVLDRLGGLAEGRYHIVPSVYTFARLNPYALGSEAILEEDSAPARLKDNSWRFGFDVSAGAAWNIPRTFGARATMPMWWLVVDGGYAWAQSKHLALHPELDDSDPRSKIALNLGAFAPRGAFFRVSVAASF